MHHHNNYNGKSFNGLTYQSSSISKVPPNIEATLKKKVQIVLLKCLFLIKSKKNITIMSLKKGKKLLNLMHGVDQP